MHMELVRQQAGKDASALRYNLEQGWHMPRLYGPPSAGSEPSSARVIVTARGCSTPRIDMHMCVHSITTRMPTGCSTCQSASAI
eukprot:scaffold18899_cov39-Tisochrysis_lutea.AAC.1